ncbi:MAG: hypothetical protein SFX72_05945 [Isosphaeraceae bacterium]|nr:hypothetical protein [Isosphaeraceae bacterium]
MFNFVRSKLRAFLEDPLGNAVDGAVFVIMLAVGAAILIGAVRYAIGIVRQVSAS